MEEYGVCGPLEAGKMADAAPGVEIFLSLELESWAASSGAGDGRCRAALATGWGRVICAEGNNIIFKNVCDSKLVEGWG